MKHIHIVAIAFLLFISFPVHAEEINAGFVQGLWYSSDQILEGVPVRVYAALRNNTSHDLTGTVRFMDNGKRIGSAPVSALSGRLVETWIDWTPSAGEHSLSIALSDAELHVIGGETTQENVAGITVEDTVTADIDTDKDGIGNLKDTDDDNDGILDEEEISRGSNPLVSNPKPLEVPIAVAEETELAMSIATSSDKTGLEQYIENETASALLGNVTNKVESAKESLDAYREAREQKLTSQGTASSMDNATITRSSIEPKSNPLNTFISGVRTLLEKIYTVVLWTLSHILAHPAFIQILLLVGILYLFYKTARRLGGRQNT